ncbi:MAG TPA: DUF1990 family protein [Acidimicrobiales bacterium]|nr:DUF1990 family protein [Acidimicrobiales bacterium]
MARRTPRYARIVATALWPFGIGLTSWHYMWRTTPLHRRERTGSPGHDDAPPLPDGVSDDDVLRPEEGVGPLFHRRYRIRVVDAELSAEELMSTIKEDPNRAAPTEFARFTKVEGEEGRLAVGDEFVVRMPGPWNGPVRVVATMATSFRLATLSGHLEAGQIEFRASDDGGGLFVTVESWARSGDRLSKLLYQNLRMAKEVQLHMWTSFLERAARVAGGRMVGGIDVETRRLDELAAAKRALDELHDESLNFDLRQRAEFTPENGWTIDEYVQPLPPEEPGPPEPDGSWEAARQLMRDYEFADPSIVRAVYEADRPLEERDMMLEARFHGLRFHLGVRVGGVTEETREVDGRPARVWGWNYRTLRGHLEMGQIDYEVWKWLDTGEVEFRISAFSRAAHIPNPIVRLGFRIFGRREQVRFARRACERMASLTAAALGRSPDEVAVTGEKGRVAPRATSR